jgi:hypothetical protein
MFIIEVSFINFVIVFIFSYFICVIEFKCFISVPTVNIVLLCLQIDQVQTNIHVNKRGDGSGL